MRQLLFFILFILSSRTSNSQHWEGVGGGTDTSSHVVYDLFPWNNNLYVAGNFGFVGGSTILSEGFGLWNNVQWLPGNTDFLAGVPKSFTAYQNSLVMAGGFQRVNGNKYCRKIARQDSAGWLPLGSGVTNGSVVNCMAVYNGDLFIGGQFTEVDSTIVANRIARWDGTNWHAMGNGFTGGFGNVNDMVVFQNELYVCGFFTTIDGMYAPGICRWNGTNWDTLGSGINGNVNCMFVDSVNNRLYVGGQFGSAGGVQCPTGVAYWDGSIWFPVGNNPLIPAVDLIIYNGILYNASTQYLALNSLGDSIKYIAWFDGVNWNPVPGGLSSTGNCFEIYQNELYVGGYFQYAGDSLVNGIAKWIPGSLGMSEQPDGNLEMKITPNPAKDEVILEINLKKLTKLKLQIADVKGGKIHNEDFSGNGKLIHKTNTSKFSSGIYVFSVYDEGQLLGSTKVVIEK